MKSITLAAVCCFSLAFSYIYAQNDIPENKQKFLKNYKAPDFRIHRLDLGFNLNGTYSEASPSANRFNENINLDYGLNANSQRYQGFFGTVVNSNAIITENAIGDGLEVTTNTSVSLQTENFFYLKNKWFLGVHGRVSSYFNTNNGNSNSSTGLRVLPVITAGYGRLEPVHYARNAMDIERALSKGGRLSEPLSIGQLNTLADRLTEINNVRFYDFRLRRIEQFEALDTVLAGFDAITKRDMRYFANVSDAYLYAKNFQRFSGGRAEIGVTQGYSIDQVAAFFVTNTQVNQSYLVARYRYELPQNYLVQHGLEVGALAGIQNSIVNDVASAYDPAAWFNAVYELGLYPTTRTHFSFALGGSAFLDNNALRLASGLRVIGDVYFSPRFRLSFQTDVTIGNPSVIGEYAFLLPNVSGSNGFMVQSTLNLRYAIF